MVHATASELRRANDTPVWSDRASLTLDELNEKYESSCGTLTRGDLLLIARRVNGSELNDPSDAADKPFIEFIFGSHRGKIRVAFWHFDYLRSSTPGLEKPVRVKTSGEVTDDVLAHILGALTSELPDMTPAAAPVVEIDAPIHGSEYLG